MTPATTGTTSTSAAVAMLRCERSGSIAAPSASDRRDAHRRAERTSAPGHCRTVASPTGSQRDSGRPFRNYSGRDGPVKILFRPAGGTIESMADFLVVARHRRLSPW